MIKRSPRRGRMRHAGHAASSFPTSFSGCQTPSSLHSRHIVGHNRPMATVSLSQAHKSFSYVVETAQHEAVIVEHRGRPRAVVLSPAEYERLRDAAEELEDVAAFDAALAEAGPSVCWEQVDVTRG